MEKYLSGTFLECWIFVYWPILSLAELKVAYKEDWIYPIGLHWYLSILVIRVTVIYWLVERCSTSFLPTCCLIPADPWLDNLCVYPVVVSTWCYRCFNGCLNWCSSNLCHFNFMHQCCIVYTIDTTDVLKSNGVSKCVPYHEFLATFIYIASFFFCTAAELCR